MEIKKLAVEETSFLHLRDANDELLYEKKEVVQDGVAALVDDKDKPVGIDLYGPGSKPFAKAQASRNNRFTDRMKKKGKSNLSAAEQVEENAAFLAACTKGFRNIQYDQLEGEALFMAVYSDSSVGFIAEQASKHLGEWGNFKKASTTS